MSLNDSCIKGEFLHTNPREVATAGVPPTTPAPPSPMMVECKGSALGCKTCRQRLEEFGIIVLAVLFAIFFWGTNILAMWQGFVRLF